MATRQTAPLHSELLHGVIQERIKALIARERLRPGDPLPAEGQFALELGVGRNSVREAVKALQTLGIVESRHGRGLFVGGFSLDPLVDGLALRILAEGGPNGSGAGTVAELIDLRQVIETHYVRRAARSLTPENLEELRSLGERMQASATAGEPAYEADRLFHEALYAPLRNTLLVQLIGVFWRVFYVVRGELPGTPPPHSRVARSHTRILAALEARDPDAAAEAMASHFTDIASWIEPG